MATAHPREFVRATRAGPVPGVRPRSQDARPAVHQVVAPARAFNTKSAIVGNTILRPLVDSC